MSEPRRSLGPVIAYLLTLLGLVLAGIWLWSAMRHSPAAHDGHAAPAVQQPPMSGAPPPGEDFSTSERQQLEDILRHKATDGEH